MIQLLSKRLCSVECEGTCIDSKCSCLIPLNDIHYCALGYFGGQGPRRAWYDKESQEISYKEKTKVCNCEAISRPWDCIKKTGDSPLIELSVANKETLIGSLHRKWIEYLRFHPEDSWLDSSMIEYPEDPPKLWPIVYIPVCHLKEGSIARIYTTLHCFTPEVDKNGEIPVFARKGILEFLLAYQVEGIIGTIDRWNFTLDEQEGLPLSTIAAKISIDIGKAFAFFVGRFGGALSVTQHGEWCIFESR